MRQINSIPISAIVFVIFLFGNNYSCKSASANIVVKSFNQNYTYSDLKHPCEVITIDILREVLKLGEIEVTYKESGSSFPTCRYVWDGGNNKIMTIGGHKTEIDIECNVTIVIVDKEVSKYSYNASVKSYQDATELLSIGDYAVWSDKRKQMTVLIGKNLFHVHMDVVPDNEYNKEKAIALSEIIIDSF